MHLLSQALLNVRKYILKFAKNMGIGKKKKASPVDISNILGI